jgi:hypothetical protein
VIKKIQILFCRVLLIVFYIPLLFTWIASQSERDDFHDEWKTAFKNPLGNELNKKS